jgi:hypothetical protein
MKTISPAQHGAVVEADQRGLCDLDPSILEKDLLILSENRYFCFSLGYLPQFPLVAALRAELRLDFTAHTPLLDPVSVQVKPLLADFMELDTQLVDHQVVVLQETLVEKVAIAPSLSREARQAIETAGYLPQSLADLTEGLQA